MKHRSPIAWLSAIALTVLATVAASTSSASLSSPYPSPSSPLVSAGWETSVAPPRVGVIVVDFAVTVENVSSEPTRPACRALLDGTNVVDEWGRSELRPGERKRVTGTIKVPASTTSAQLDDLEPSCR